MNPLQERIRIKNVGRSARLITNQGDRRPHPSAVPRRSLYYLGYGRHQTFRGYDCVPFSLRIRKPISEEKAKQIGVPTCLQPQGSLQVHSLKGRILAAGARQR